MSALSDYMEDALLKHVLGTPYTAPTTFYLAIFSDNPAEDASGTEFTAASYARIDFTSNITDNADGTAQNTADILSVTAAENWGTATHIAIFDAVTTGNMLWYGAVGQSKTINSGDRFKIAAGNLVFGLI